MKKNIFIVSIVVMIAVIAFSISVYQTASNPLHKAEDETFAVAKSSAGLTEVDDFYWYNGTETYFTVTGTNQEGEAIVAIVAQDGGATTVFNQADVITESEAIQITKQAANPKEILEARIGMEKGKAIWEVAYKQENGRLGYYVLSLETGEWLKGIENI
ncbi:DUF5590 domain-containing protein [Desemzia sp. RIT804]|uniref:cell wall elongation regulator TseB-like domain-containing protein n=1 Tax=Desemzia sp. RIT 804 TaxID=2810209 RepID=UPI00194FAA8F|nr:DUF5590 domain-containing protein [Desemzia sp. RIT 804]MBM6613733.1 DUF5590 domain-containing protein [Desemzia sp. RIT 804]